MRRGTLAQARLDARNEARERRKARSEAGQQSRAPRLTFAAKGRPLGQRSQARHEKSVQERKRQADLRLEMEQKALVEAESQRIKRLKKKWAKVDRVLKRPYVTGLGPYEVTERKQQPSKTPNMVVLNSPPRTYKRGGVGWAVENTPSPPRRRNPPVQPPVLPPIRRRVGLRM